MSEPKSTFIHTKKIDDLLSGITPYIPFSYLWIYKRSLPDSGTVLDIGCGDGLLMDRIAKNKNLDITGIDLYEDSLQKAGNRKIYSKLIKGDIIIECQKLVKQKKKYDIVFCSQVIEHITKKEGNKLLKLMDKLANNKVIVATPIGFMNQPEVFIGDNPYQHHKSGWSVKEFLKRDYRVNGLGFKYGWSETGLSRGSNGIVVLFSVIMSYIFSPLAFFLPEFAAGMMCVKDK